MNVMMSQKLSLPGDAAELFLTTVSISDYKDGLQLKSRPGRKRVHRWRIWRGSIVPMGLRSSL